MSVVSPRPFANPAADAAKLLARLGLFLLLIVIPVIGVVSRRAIFVLLPVGAALLFLSVLVGHSEDGLRRLRGALLSATGLTVLFLGFWCALSLIWTPFHLEAANRLVKGFGTALFVAVAIAFLPERTKISNLYLLPAGVVVAAVATFVLVFVGPASFRGPDTESSMMDRSVITLVLLVWPALGVLSLRERWAMAGALAIIVTIVAVAAWTPIALAAMAAGALTFSTSTSKPARAARQLAAIFAGFMLLAPLLPLGFALWPGPQGEAEGVTASLLVWGDLVRNEWARLITGHGLDMATRGVAVGFLPPETPNTILFEIWYDLGIIGAVASSILVACAFLAAGRASPGLAPFLLAGFVAVLSIMVLGLSTAQLWWVSLVSLEAIAFALVLRGQHRVKRPAAQTVDTPDSL